MSTRDNINALADNMDDDIILLEPPTFDAAIVGLCAETSRVIYDRTKVLKVMMAQGMTDEDAEEFFDFNTLRPCAKGWPIFVDTSYIEHPATATRKRKARKPIEAQA